MPSAKPPPQTDILISGGGMIGLTQALALARAGFSVRLVERIEPEHALNPTFDGRASALAYTSCNLLEALGLWPDLAEHAEPIREIRVSDGDVPLFLHFDHEDVGDRPLGHMVENRHLRHVLLAAVRKADGVTIDAPHRITATECTMDGVTAELDNGTTVRARLLVGAEGRTSPTREMAGIRCHEWRYGQDGIVTTVTHERPHRGIAHERFLPSGPFAILPLVGNRSSIVWTERRRLADAVMGLSDAGFDDELGKRFGSFLGRVHATGPRWRYPLALQVAARFVDRRVCLIGDSAHGIHPIAGQGANLGFKDVAALTEVLVDAARTGTDIGADGVLARYQRWRRVDTVALSVVTDALNHLFSNDIAPVALARDMGLGAVNRMAPLKKFFMNHA
ncbi:MAG: UbiH/UbiF/VisC/COQ6 family ubiquinone biosynthesis hydroxylase, partial [Sphingomonadales bacterium]